MPEGDTIFRAAAQLRRVFEGKRIVSATAREEILDPAVLQGLVIRSIEARGKHLFFYLGEEQVLHSHMGMTGSWHIYRPQEGWRKPRNNAFLSLETGEAVAVCFTPKRIELISTTALQRDSYLSRLGPDLLASHINEDEIVRRFRSQNPLPVGEVVMNQTVVCGVGNVYKSEILFLERMHPETPIEKISDVAIKSLVRRARRLMQQNLEGYPRRTRARPAHHVWVYRRRGQDCSKCGATIEMIRQGKLARSTYMCPHCQRYAPSIDGTDYFRRLSPASD